MLLRFLVVLLRGRVLVIVVVNVTVRTQLEELEKAVAVTESRTLWEHAEHIRGEELDT